MTPVPNQPIAFERQVDCHIDPTEWPIPVQSGDVTQFQFALDNCLADGNIIYNGDFTRDGGSGIGWVITAPSSWLLQPYFGNILHIFGAPLGYVGQTVMIAPYTLVQLTVTINQNTGQCGLAMLSAGTIVWDEQFVGNVSGTFTFWIYSANQIDSLFLTANGASNATFGQIQINPVNTYLRANLLDSTGTVIYPDIPFNVNNGWATFSYDWAAADTPQGCYTIEVYDPCDCSQNGLIALDLITGTYPSAIYGLGGLWAGDFAGSWQIGAGQAVYTGTGVPDTSDIRVSNSPLCVGTSYDVSYRVTGLANAQVRVSLGNTVGTWRTANGTHTETLVCTVHGGLSFTAQSIGVAGSLTVYSVSIVATTPIATYTSPTLSYRTTDECCTKLVTICNDSDAMNIGFVGTGFAPSIRLDAHLRGTGFGSERNQYRDSVGRSKVYFGQSVKVSELAFEAPEFVHDFIRLAVIADHLFIDGSEFEVQADEYPTMSLNDWDDLSGVQLPVSPKVENTRNRRISSAIRGCGADGATIGVITGGTRPFPDLSTSTDGKPITIDG